MAKRGLTVTWNIENFYYWPGLYETASRANKLDIHSSEFLVNTTRMRLLMESEGPPASGVTNVIAVSLIREPNDGSPIEITMNIEFFILLSDGSPKFLQKYNGLVFHNKTQNYLLRVYKSDMDALRVIDFLNNDSLKVCCRMWDAPWPERNPELDECVAKTSLRIKCVASEWTVRNFSTLPLRRQIEMYKSRFTARDEPLVSVIISLNNNREIIVEVRFVFKISSLHICKLFLMDSVGNREQCGKKELWPDEKCCLKFSENLTLQKLVKNKECYLPNDVLTIQIEFEYFSGKADSQEIYKPDYKFHSSQSTNLAFSMPRNPTFDYVDKCTRDHCHPISTMKDDLLFLYNDREFCDTTIHTETETFSVHKLILIMRSPVFRAMFTTDMKESIDHSIDILDFDSETVRQMLLFVYTDNVQDMNWDNAKNLYRLSDKYQILSLRQRCSSFFLDNLSTSNVSEVLLLSDMHSDSDFKKAIHEFIKKYAKDIFRSRQWKEFLKCNSVLGAEAMRIFFD